jgi:hypothetical protein
MAWLVVSGLAYGLSPPAMLLMVALHLLVAVPATIVGAWSSRAVLPRSDRSILALVGALAILLLLNLGPLRWLSIPMIGWMRAANAGPDAFMAAFPVLAAHILVWSAVAGAGYVDVLRLRA